MAGVPEHAACSVEHKVEHKGPQPEHMHEEASLAHDVPRWGGVAVSGQPSPARPEIEGAGTIQAGLTGSAARSFGSVRAHSFPGRRNTSMSDSKQGSHVDVFRSRSASRRRLPPASSFGESRAWEGQTERVEQAILQRREKAAAGGGCLSTLWGELRKRGRFIMALCSFVSVVVALCFVTSFRAIDGISLALVDRESRSVLGEVQSAMAGRVAEAAGMSRLAQAMPLESWDNQKRIYEQRMTVENRTIDAPHFQNLLKSYASTGFALDYVNLGFEDSTYAACLGGPRFAAAGLFQCVFVGKFLDPDGEFRGKILITLWDRDTMEQLPWRTPRWDFKAMTPCLLMAPPGAICDYHLKYPYNDTLDGWIYSAVGWYDPTVRPWYKQAPRVRGTLRWLDPFTSVFPTTLLNSLVFAMYSKKGDFVGAGGYDGGLGQVQRIVDRFSSPDRASSGGAGAQKTTAVIYDSQGMLIAVSADDDWPGTAALVTQAISVQEYPDPSKLQLDKGCVSSDPQGQAYVMVCSSYINNASKPFRMLTEVFLRHEETLVSNRSVNFKDTLLGKDYYISKIPIVIELTEGLDWHVMVLIPAGEVTTGFLELLYAIISVLFGILILVLVYTQFNSSRIKNKVRNLRFAPIVGRLCIIFTEIEDSTSIWAACPHEMDIAVQLHHTIIRRIVCKHNAYEVKTNGDCFMIACQDSEVAVRVCNEIQQALLEADWPEKLLALPSCKREYFRQDTHPTETLIFNGPRVRCGIHLGQPCIVWDEVAKGYDYYGEAVNKAAKIEAIAIGGQTLASEEVVDSLPENVLPRIHARLVGCVRLKGFAQEHEIFSLLPNEMAARDEFIAEKMAREDEEQRRSYRALMSSRGGLTSVSVVV